MDTTKMTFRDILAFAGLGAVVAITVTVVAFGANAVNNITQKAV